MSPAASQSSKGMIWTGRVLSGIVVLFLIFDGVTKLIRESHVVQAMHMLGYPDDLTTPLGAVLLVCTTLYVIPRTSVLGAILITGWLGGAIALMLLAASPSHPVWFPFLFGVILWLGLYLRNGKLRSLVPYQKEA